MKAESLFAEAEKKIRNSTTSQSISFFALEYNRAIALDYQGRRGEAIEKLRKLEKSFSKNKEKICPYQGYVRAALAYYDWQTEREGKVEEIKRLMEGAKEIEKEICRVEGIHSILKEIDMEGAV